MIDMLAAGERWKAPAADCCRYKKGYIFKTPLLYHFHGAANTINHNTTIFSLSYKLYLI